MNYKKMMLVAFVLLAILTIGAVSASDGGDELAAAEIGGDSDVIASPDYNDEILGNSTTGGFDIIVDGNGSVGGDDPDEYDVNGTVGGDDPVEDDVNGTEVVDSDIGVYFQNEKIYTDSENEVVFVIVPIGIEGTIYVEVNDDQKDSWDIEFDDGDETSYHEWGLEDLEIFEAGNYTIVVKLDDEIIGSEDISVYEFADDEFRAVYDDEEDIVSLYCPEDIGATLKITVDKEYDEDTQRVYEESFNLTAGWSDWNLCDLGLEREGIWTEFTFTIYSNGEEVLSYNKRIRYATEDEPGDDPYEDYKIYYLDFNDVNITDDSFVVGVGSEEPVAGRFVMFNANATLFDKNVSDDENDWIIKDGDYFYQIGLDDVSLENVANGDVFTLAFYYIGDDKPANSIVLEFEVGEDYIKLKEWIDPAKFRIINPRDDMSVLETGDVFALYCPDGINGKVTVTVDNEIEAKPSVSLNLEDKDENNLIHFTLSDLGMMDPMTYYLGVTVDSGEFKEYLETRVYVPISYEDYLSMIVSEEDGGMYFNGNFLIDVEVPSEYENGRIILFIDGAEVFSKDLSEFSNDTAAAYYWKFLRTGPEEDDFNKEIKVYQLTTDLIENPELKEYDVQTLLIINNQTFEAAREISVKKATQLFFSYEEEIESENSDADAFGILLIAKYIDGDWVPVDRLASGRILVTSENGEVVLMNRSLSEFEKEPFDDYMGEIFYQFTLADLNNFEGIENGENIKFSFLLKNGYEEASLMAALFIEEGRFILTAPDFYKISISEEFDINDENATVVSIFCPEGTQGYFIIQTVFDWDNDIYLSNAYAISEDDYGKFINFTASDFGITEAGEYAFRIYLADNPEDFTGEDAIWDDMATFRAIDYTQFRLIEEKTWALNMLTTGNVIAVYCPEGSEGNVSISVRRGDDDEAFHTSVKSVSEKDDENLLHWTLAELNMEESGEYFISVYNGDDEIERGMRLEVDIPIYFDEIAYLDSDSILVSVVLPYEMEDAEITFKIGENTLLVKSLSEFMAGENGTDSPYWNVRSGSGWVDDNYKVYFVQLNHIEYAFEEGRYEMTVDMAVEGREIVTRTENVELFARTMASNENLSIEIFSHKNYPLGNDWIEVVLIKAYSDCGGNIVITVADNDWTFERPLGDLESKNDEGDFQIYPNSFDGLEPGEYEITVAYYEGEDLIISTTGVVNFYVEDDDENELHIGIWDEDDERGTLYTDAEGNVLNVDIPPAFEGNIIVIVNGNEVDNWEIETDDEDGWAYKDWGLEELGISKAGDYTIELIYDNGEETQVLINDTITVSVFTEDDFRAMILYSTEVIKFYAPQDAEGDVTIITEQEIEGGELEKINEKTFEITDEHRGNWVEFRLADLGFEADGAFRVFTLTVTNATGAEVYRYRCSHVDGERQEEGDDDESIHDIQFRFITLDDDGYMEFDKGSNVPVAYVFIPKMDEFEDVAVTVRISLNGQEIKTFMTSDDDVYGFYSSRLNALGYEIDLDLSEMQDKDILTFHLEAEFENGESAIIEDEEMNIIVLQDDGDKFLAHDDVDFERLEVTIFSGNLTLGSPNAPDLMGCIYDGSFIIITISNALNITEGNITVSDGTNVVFSRLLSECAKEYDYGSIGYTYSIPIEDVIDSLPEGTNLTVAFDYGENSFVQKRIRFEDYLYALVLVEDINRQFRFEVSEDMLLHESDTAIYLSSDSNRQAILFDLGAGYFIVYVNGVKVENLGKVSYNTWKEKSDWREEDYDYLDNFASDEDAFLDYVTSYWGSELELFRLTSWNQGAPEIEITLKDLGITESGTYNIRIVHYPSVPGGLDDHSDIFEEYGLYAGEMLIPTYTELLNQNISCNFDPDYAGVEILKERVYKNGFPFMFTFQFGDNVFSESNRILVYINGELAFNGTTLFWEENDEGEMELVNMWFLNDGQLNEDFFNEYGTLDAGEYEAVFYLVKGDAAPVEFGRGNFAVLKQRGNMNFEIGSSVFDDGKVHTVLYVDIPEGNWDDYSLSINIGDSEEIYLDEEDWFARWFDEYVIFKDDAIYFKDSLDDIIGKGPVAIDLGVLDEGTHIFVMYWHGEETVFGDWDFYQNEFTVKNTVDNASEIVISNDIAFDYGESGFANVSLVGAKDVIANVVGHDEAKVTFENGIMTVSGLDAGSYTLNVTTVPEEGFVAVNELINITVNKIDANLTVEADDVVVGQTTTIRVFAFGIVKVRVGGNTYTINCTGVGYLVLSFDAGTHNVVAEFEGDKNIKPAIVNATFTVSKLTPTIVITPGDGAVEGNDLDVTVEVANATGTVDINGKVVELKDGKANATLENLVAGDLNITVAYSGDANYVAANESKKITVKAKENPGLLVSVADVIVGETAVVNIEIDADVTGKVTVDGNEVEIVNGKGTYNISGLAAGDHKITVAFEGDKYFNAFEVNETFRVSKVASSVKVDVESAFFVGDEIVISVTNSTAVVVTIDDNVYDVVDGKIVVNAADLGVGRRHIVATIAEDNMFLASSDNATFEIFKGASSVAIDVDSSFTVGDTVTITLTNSSAVTVLINGKAYDVVNGKVVVDSADLGSGTFLVVASIAEDELFLASSSNATFTVAKKASSVAIDVDSEFIIGDEIVITVTNSSAAVVTIDGKAYDVVDGKVVVNSADLGVGRRHIVATIAEDNMFLASSANATFTVAKKASSVALSVDSTFTVGQTITITVTNSTAVTVLVDGKAYEVKDGKVVVDSAKLGAGAFMVVASIAEDDFFLASSANATFTVSKVETPAGENPFNVDVSKPVESKAPTYSISLPSDATGNLTVTIGDKKYTQALVNGAATVVVADMPAGSYDIEITYSGDSKYAPIVKTSKATVKVDPRIVASDATVQYTAGKYYSVTVYGDDGKVAAGKTVVFTLNGKKIATATTGTNGVAKFKITQPPVTKGNLVITALGKSVTKKLTIKHIVTLYSTTFKKSATKITFKAKLAKVNGKVLKKKTITFKVNGKKVATAKTDKNGVAKITLKDAKATKVLKTLKAGKKVTYQAVYSKDVVQKSTKAKK